MFGIGIPELIVIFIVALIFIGPKKLPEFAMTLAKGLREFKKVVEDVKEELDAGGGELANQKEELWKEYKEVVENVKGLRGLGETEGKKESLEAQTTKEKVREEDN